MFWGLIMEPGRCYTQTVKISFHVSMAALDISNSSAEPAQVMCVFEGRNYLLCTLNRENKLQCALDLNFEAGTKVSFATNGKSHVHLTGYLTALEDDLDEEEQEEEEEQVVSLSKKDKTLTKKDKKRPKKEPVEEPPNKKFKITKNSIPSSGTEEEEEESSDSDFELDKQEEEEGEWEDEEEDEDEDEQGSEEEASSLSELDSEEEQPKKSPTPKQNGTAKANATSKLKKKPQQEKAQTPKGKPKKQEKQEQKQPQGKKTVLKGGVIVQELKEGSGETVKSGKFVHVYYEGRFKENNKMFDSTTKGPGFSFRVGKGEVIKGWDTGLIGMKVGGKRRIICPANAAYGAKGSPPVIPPNATLVFDIELKKMS